MPTAARRCGRRRPVRTRSRWRNAISARVPGVVDGAFAELPRYFADAGRVMDLETRLMWCMEKLQGVKHADLVKKPYPAGGQPVKDLGAIATYVASKSSGMKYRREARPAAGAGGGRRSARRIFFRRQGPHDFACATCHNESGKRIRLQGLPYPRRPEGGQAGGRAVAGLSRLDHAGDDDAAPAVRLLLADAHAGTGDGLGRQRGADRAISPRMPRAARSPSPGLEALRSKPCDCLAPSLVARRPRAALAHSRRREGRCRDRGGVSDRAGGLGRAVRPGRNHEAMLGQRRTRRRRTSRTRSPSARRPGSNIRADGKLIGDWKSGEKLAQSGYGLRFTDYPARQANGGNCYACHQITKAEVSYGTLGPSLLGYGKMRKFSRGRHQGGVREDLQLAGRAIPARTCRASAPTRC